MRHRLTLELGGNDAGIVLPDVDVDAAIAPIFWGMFLVNGQGCITIKRLLVHENRYDEVAAALSKFAAEQVLGDGFDPATTIGPIQNRAQLLRLQATWAAIQKDGAADCWGSSPTAPAIGAERSAFRIAGSSRAPLARLGAIT